MSHFECVLGKFNNFNFIMKTSKAHTQKNRTKRQFQLNSYRSPEKIRNRNKIDEDEVKVSLTPTRLLFFKEEQTKKDLSKTIERQRTTKKGANYDQSPTRDEFSVNNQKMIESKLSQYSTYDQEKAKYYLYWKEKAYEYQKENFHLRVLNDQLRQEVQILKKQIIKMTSFVSQYESIVQKNEQLQEKLKKSIQTQNELYLHIKKLEQSLNSSRINNQNLRKSAQKIYPQNQGALLKQLKFNLYKYELQNTQLNYTIKQYQDYFRENGIQSIWISGRSTQNKIDKYSTVQKELKNPYQHPL